VSDGLRRELPWSCKWIVTLNGNVDRADRSLSIVISPQGTYFVMTEELAW